MHGLYPNVHQLRSSLILFLFVQAKQPRVSWLGPNMVSIDLMRDQRSLDDVNGTPKGWRDYRKTSNISRTLVGNKIVEHSDVVGASPVGAAPTTSSFSTFTSGFKGFGKDIPKPVQESFKCWDLVWLILETWQ